MNDEKVIERKVDYFLRYTADIPADEISLHNAFSTGCVCAPDWIFDPENGWHKLTHHPIEK